MANQQGVQVPAEQQDQAVEHEVKSPIIEALGISRVYQLGNEMVSPVVDVTLQVGYGDFAVIFGPSGAGKSTLMNILLGLEKPDVGEVFLKGESLYGLNEEQRTKLRAKRISYLPQGQYWIEYLNVVENVALPLILQGVPRKKAMEQAREFLAVLDLKDYFNHRPDELSTGQQQKASLARALIKRPWIIFADEPTAHLDSKSVEDVTEIMIKSTKELGVTIVMVTHDLNFLKKSKKWFFMKDGRIWDIRDQRNPFNNIRDVISFVESGKADKREGQA